MADVMKLSDGSLHTVFDLKDVLEIIDARLGDEPRRWLEDYLADLECPDLEEELKAEQDHRHEVMQALREQSETIARLIREKEIDRRALSTAAGVIGSITWREMNV